MGNEIRRVELRVAKLEKAAAEQRGIIERLQQAIGAVAESAGSALAVEALMELAGLPAAQAKMGEVAKRKQAEAEAVMAGRVKAAVEGGRLVPGDVAGAQSLIVGERSEGASVKYRVDLHPAPKAYLGKKAGDVVEEEGSKTEIREVYEAVKVKMEPIQEEIEKAVDAGVNLALESSPPQEILIPDATPVEYERIVKELA